MRIYRINKPMLGECIILASDSVEIQLPIPVLLSLLGTLAYASNSNLRRIIIESPVDDNVARSQTKDFNKCAVMFLISDEPQYIFIKYV